MSYNGWKDYPTWNVALWIDNDPGSYEAVRDMARDCAGADYPRVALADTLKSYVEGMNPLADDASIFTDLLGWAINSADWHELAEHYLDEVETEDA